MLTLTQKPPSTFASRLRSLRDEKDLTQREVATLTGYSKRAIEHWEEGRGVPKEMTQFAVLEKVRRARAKKRKETK